MTEKIIVGSRKEQGLENLKAMTVDMFLQLEKMIDLSKILLDTNDREIALQIIEEDDYMDDFLSDITIEISNYIIKEQPIAIDLRICLGTLKLVLDLERIGDYFKNFAKFTLKEDLDSKTQQNLVSDLLSQIQLRTVEVKAAYMNLDHKAAKQIAKRDREIDELTGKLLDNVNKKLIKANNDVDVKSLARIIKLARTFERSGDHLVNICEQISYINRGQIYHYS